MYQVKCFSPRKVFYDCLIEDWVEAVAMAHVLTDTYLCRSNITKTGESSHCYNVLPALDIDSDPDS